MIKIMIVDDERNIREGIAKLINWRDMDCEVVANCANGNIAIQYLQSNPVDIVVTDIKMPVMDGLELSKKINTDFPDTKVIILTAYSDFSLAKQAIKYNVVDFIVKNDFMDELPHVVTKTISTIMEEREKESNKQITDDKEQLYTELFHKIILSGDVTDENIQLYRLNEFKYCMCACEIDAYDKDSGKRDLISILSNILKIALKECHFNILPLTDSYCVIFIRYPKDSRINLNTIIEYFNDIIVMVEEFMRIDIRFGLSRQVENPIFIKNGYDEAKESLSGIMTKSSELRVYSELQDKDGQEISYDVDRHMNKICEMTFDETVDEADTMLKELYEKLATSNCTFEQCKLYMLVICSSIIHKAIRYYIDVEQDFNEMEKDTYARIQNVKTMFSLVQIGTDTIDKIRTLCIGKKNLKNDLVKKVDDCIRNNYQEELTLQYISNELYLNSSYLSRTYKKLTGSTITEKITMYRVAKAKELLSDSSMKIYEVAKAVGIKDAAYFTNIFMKYVGQSPTEYRQEHL